MKNLKHIPTEKQKQSYRGWKKKSPLDCVINNIATTKKALADLPTHPNFSDEAKNGLEIYYKGKIDGLEQTYQLIQSLTK